jgi:hypothetical protein
MGMMRLFLNTLRGKPVLATKWKRSQNRTQPSAAELKPETDFKGRMPGAFGHVLIRRKNRSRKSLG